MQDPKLEILMRNMQSNCNLARKRMQKNPLSYWSVGCYLDQLGLINSDISMHIGLLERNIFISCVINSRVSDSVKPCLKQRIKDKMLDSTMLDISTHEQYQHL